MSDLRYGPTPTRGGTWRYVVVAGVTATAVPAALIAAFVAAITWTGCFLACTGPNHPVGGLLFLLALGLATAGPASAWLLLRRWAMVGLAVLLDVLVAAAVLVALGAG